MQREALLDAIERLVVGVIEYRERFSGGCLSEQEAQALARARNAVARELNAVIDRRVEEGITARLASMQHLPVDLYRMLNPDSEF